MSQAAVATCQCQSKTTTDKLFDRWLRSTKWKPARQDQWRRWVLLQGNLHQSCTGKSKISRWEFFPPLEDTSHTKQKPSSSKGRCTSRVATLTRSDGRRHCSSRLARTSLVARRTSLLYYSLSCDASECVPGNFSVLSFVFLLLKNFHGYHNLLLSIYILYNSSQIFSGAKIL